MIDQRLEALLARTAGAIEYPPTPDLSARVLGNLSAHPSPPAAGPLSPLGRGLGRGVAFWPALGLTLLAAVLVLVAALAISPTRDAIARFFGVEGSKIEFLPTPLPGETATPFPTAVQSLTPDLRSVPGVELDRLPELAGFTAALPAVPEQRIETNLLFYGRDAVVVHAYPDFDLWQSRIEGFASFGKQVRPEGTVENVEVGSVPGRWLTGAEHVVSYTDRNGAHIPASQRIVDRNTLIWRTDAFFYRIETDLSLEEALRIAKTLP
jgi:hypothetical protein